MRVRYHWTQILVSFPHVVHFVTYFNSLRQGIFICVAGLGLLVASEQLTDKDWDPVSRGKGDAFMIAGATLYGFSTFSLHFHDRPC